MRGLSIFHNEKGFTFFEVIAVLVLIGIFTTVAIVQHARTDPTLIVQSQVLQSHIRYAQMRSMNSDVRWGIDYHHSAVPANRYYTIYAGNPGNIVDLPGESETRVRLGDMGITVESGVGATPSAKSFRISFDSWGQPHMDAAPNPVTAPILLNLKTTGQAPVPLTIIERTGFIP